MVNDALVPARDTGAQSYSASFLEAIDAGLSLRPAERPQDMAAFRALLLGEDQTVVWPTGAAASQQRVDPWIAPPRSVRAKRTAHATRPRSLLRGSLDAGACLLPQGLFG
jgi:hypothetical protein